MPQSKEELQVEVQLVRNMLVEKGCVCFFTEQGEGFVVFVFCDVPKLSNSETGGQGFDDQGNMRNADLRHWSEV